MQSSHFFFSNYCWILPLMFAIACWLCVSAILFFIFHPAKQKNITGIKMHGFIYAAFSSTKNSVINKLTELILSKKETIKKSVVAQENIDKMMPEIDAHIQEFLTVKVPKELPMIAMFLGEKTTHQIKEVFIKELSVLFPNILSQYADTLLNEKKLNELIAAQFSDSAETLMVTAFKRNCTNVFMKVKIFSFIFGLLFGCILMFVTYLFA